MTGTAMGKPRDISVHLAGARPGGWLVGRRTRGGHRGLVLAVGRASTSLSSGRAEHLAVAALASTMTLRDWSSRSRPRRCRAARAGDAQRLLIGLDQLREGAASPRRDRDDLRAIASASCNCRARRPRRPAGCRWRRPWPPWSGARDRRSPCWRRAGRVRRPRTCTSVGLTRDTEMPVCCAGRAALTSVGRHLLRWLETKMVSRSLRPTTSRIALADLAQRLLGLLDLEQVAPGRRSWYCTDRARSIRLMSCVSTSLVVEAAGPATLTMVRPMGQKCQPRPGSRIDTSLPKRLTTPRSACANPVANHTSVQIASTVRRLKPASR